MSSVKWILVFCWALTCLAAQGIECGTALTKQISVGHMVLIKTKGTLASVPDQPQGEAPRAFLQKDYLVGTYLGQSEPESHLFQILDFYFPRGTNMSAEDAIVTISNRSLNGNFAGVIDLNSLVGKPIQFTVADRVFYPGIEYPGHGTLVRADNFAILIEMDSDKSLNAFPWNKVDLKELYAFLESSKP